MFEASSQLVLRECSCDTTNSDDGEVFLTAAMARENPLYLSIAEKLLAAVDAEMEGTVPCPLTRHELLVMGATRVVKENIIQP